MRHNQKATQRVVKTTLLSQRNVLSVAPVRACVCFVLLSSDFRDNFPDSFQHNYKSFSLQTSAPGASCPAEKRSVNRCEVTLAKCKFSQAFYFFQRNYTLNYPTQRKCSFFYSPQHSSEATVEVDNESVNILIPLPSPGI